MTKQQYYVSYDNKTGLITERGPSSLAQHAPKPQILVDQATMERIRKEGLNTVKDGAPVYIEEQWEETPATIRRWRNDELDKTDKHAKLADIPDYPMTDEQRQELLAYRQALRDCPETMVRPTRPEWL